jgi:hypothetical protein
MIEIEGFENYMITKEGKVWSKKSNRFLKPSVTSNGYSLIKCVRNGKKINKYVHRLMAETFLVNPENKLTVNHINGIKTDNRIENLEWATHSENVQHSFDNGMSKSKNRKLTIKEVNEIREKYVPWKYTLQKLADEYGVDYKTIWFIINNQTYKK